MAQELPMVHRQDIVPFLFPCPKCKDYVFHTLHEQPCGFTVKLLFMQWTSNKAYLAICEQCSVVNGQLKAEDAEKLSRNMLPKSMYVAYPQLHQFYSPGFYHENRKLFLGEPPDAQLAPLLDVWMTSYRLEI